MIHVFPRVVVNVELSTPLLMICLLFLSPVDDHRYPAGMYVYTNCAPTIDLPSRPSPDLSDTPSYKYLPVSHNVQRLNVCGSSAPAASQPLDRRRRLGGDIVGDAVHTLHFVRDARGNPLQDLGRENIPVYQKQ